jgi:hypothetical protein
MHLSPAQTRQPMKPVARRPQSDDLDINAEVRRAFPRLWMDVTYITHRTVRGRVHVSGRIVMVGDRARDGDVATMDRLYEALMTIEGVTGVEFNLDNWIFDGLAWHMSGAAKMRAQRIAQREKERRETIRQLISEQYAQKK